LFKTNANSVSNHKCDAAPVRFKNRIQIAIRFQGSDYAWQHRGARSAPSGQSGLSASYHGDFAHCTMNFRTRGDLSARHFRFPAQFRSKSWEKSNHEELQARSDGLWFR
jgi:hypothetical protein